MHLVGLRCARVAVPRAWSYGARTYISLIQDLKVGHELAAKPHCGFQNKHLYMAIGKHANAWIKYPIWNFYIKSAIG